jgi:hypothetical protein
MAVCYDLIAAKVGFEPKLPNAVRCTNGRYRQSLLSEKLKSDETMAGLRIIAICSLGFGIWWLWPTNEVAVMRDFMYGENRMESQLTIPLQRAGSGILPSILEAIQDKEMPRRRYAIWFIGIEAYEPALPVLRRILEDETEIWYFRADALEAIYLIDPLLALELSPTYVNEAELLGRYARNIRDGLPLLTLE